MKSWIYIVVGVLAAVGLSLLWGLIRPQTTVAPTLNQNSQQVNLNSPTNTSTPTTTEFSTADLPDRDPKLNFSASVPAGWVAEYVSGSQAINLYNPIAAGSTTLERSQIFVKYFEASSFQTLTTVDIKSRKETTVNNRPAMVYVIQKKSGQADFASQPAWRNLEHTVTDIRSTDTTPSLYLVVAQRPGLSPTIYDAFLGSIDFPAES